MSTDISIRQLRNTISDVVRRVEKGEHLTVTADRRPVAELVPLRRRGPVPVALALTIARGHPADRGLLAQVAIAVHDTTGYVWEPSSTPQFQR